MPLTQAQRKKREQGNGKQFDGEVLQNRLENLLGNAILERREFVRKLLDPRRNINDECGYPDAISAEEYRILYEREPIAARVVEVVPKEAWQAAPSVMEDEGDTITPFEQAFDELGKSLRGESWYVGDEGNPIWRHLLQADIDSGIGSFGILLIGFDDGKALREPVEPHRGDELLPILFLRSFPEYLVQISRWDLDRSSPRFGHPTEYLVQFHNPTDTQASSPQSSEVVHWTRCLHLAEGGDVFGIPRMRPVYNRLLDLRKLYSGSAEMYWRGAFPGFMVESHPQLGTDVEFDREAMRNEMEQMFNGLQRYAAMAGVTMKSLAPQVVDPTPQINTQIEAICIQQGIPKRKFTGSERGELSSSEDEGDWNDKLRHRNNTYTTPGVIVPFIDRLVMVGALPEPEEYSVTWPDLNSLTDLERAEIALKQTQGVVAYLQGGGENLVLPGDYLTRFQGFTQEEALEMLEAVTDQKEEKDEPDSNSPLLELVGGLTGIAELFKITAEGGMTLEQLKQVLMLFFQLDGQKADDLIADGEELQRQREAEKLRLEEEARARLESVAETDEEEDEDEIEDEENESEEEDGQT